MQGLRFSPLQSLRSFKLTDSRLLLACLGIGFFIRLVPELLAFPLPIGSDTVYYAVVMKSGVIWANWSQFFTSSWLLYALIVPAYGLLKGDPFLLLKVVAPLLFGLNVAGVYWFSRKALGWSFRMGLVAGVFFALQLASLRISWDLLRNMLGLGVLLFALSYVKDVGSKRGFALFTGLSLLCVFAHEYAAVALLSIVIGLLVWNVFKRQLSLDPMRLALGLLPALSVVAVGMYFRLNPIRFVAPQSNVIMAGDAVGGKVGGLFFLVNYLQVQNSVDSYASYWSLALSIGLLFTVLFVPCIVLVAKGFFRNGILNIWTGLLLVGSFGALVLPFSALQYWHRWMFMLVYPFTFYSVSGLARLRSKFREKRIGISGLLSSKISAIMLLLTFGLSASYLATPVVMTCAGTSLPTLSGTYRYFSTAPNVPYEDVDGVVQAMGWLNSNMVSASSVVLQSTFVYLGRLYLGQSHTIVSFDNSVSSAVNTAVARGFSRVYFVWWNVPLGWYGVSVPDSFADVRDFGRISVYAYEV